MATRPMYRRNPNLGPRNTHGLKVADAISGKWTQEYYCVLDDDGNLVDPRDRRTYDRRYDLDFAERDEV